MRPALLAAALFLTSQPPAVAPCDVSAYVVDQDPKGLNVRAAPGAASKVIAVLPNASVEGIRVHVSAGSGEWVRLDSAIEEGGDTDRVLFKGAGWVYGPLLAVDGVGGIPGGTAIRAEPSPRARVLARMLAGGDGATVRGCRGAWMYVQHRKTRGWAARDELCANSLTTCS
jgi:SH3-like domain-containing protein